MTTQMIPAVSTIDVSRFRQLMNEDPDLRVLDVRTGGEFETVHIPGSFNVPLDTLGEHARDLASVEHPVVLVCQTGGRASKAHDALTAAGKEGLYILEGGIAAWQATGGDVATGGTQRWAMDRQVRLVAGSLVLAGVLGSIAAPKAKWLAGGVAGGLVFSAVSNTCAMASMLAKVPYNRTDKCDIAGVLSELRADSVRP
jgi:rhodanese-related sulfurtransferase